jgi:hypothetical protein
MLFQVPQHPFRPACLNEVPDQAPHGFVLFLQLLQQCLKLLQKKALIIVDVRRGILLAMK